MADSMAETIAGSSGVTSGEKRAMMSPLRPTRNFSKFQRMPGSGLVVAPLWTSREEAIEVFAEGCAGFADGFGLGVDEGLVERMGIGAGDGDLLEHGEVDGVGSGAEVIDLLVGAGFLRAEVVGREAEDDEASVFEAGVESFEGFVLWGEAALGGDVDDEENFAAVVGESEVFAGDAVYRDVI